MPLFKHDVNLYLKFSKFFKILYLVRSRLRSLRLRIHQAQRMLIISCLLSEQPLCLSILFLGFKSLSKTEGRMFMRLGGRVGFPTFDCMLKVLFRGLQITLFTVDEPQIMKFAKRCCVRRAITGFELL